MDIVLLFPGQGSQKPGMGKDIAASHPEARRVFDEVDEALGTPLSMLCFEGPAEELTLTHNAQPALLAHGAALWAVARERLAPHVRAAAGHSLGEFSAYHAAGSVDVARGTRLVRRRGELMFETGLQRPGAMAAILGELTEPIDMLCERATVEAGTVVPANYNTPDQTVVSGETAGVDRAMALAKNAGAKRAVKLNVSGAFHSPLMQPAAPGLRSALDDARLEEPRFPIFSNVSEQACTSAREAADLLLRQLTSPVRWLGMLRNLAATFPGALFVEMGPGNVLAGLAKRIVPDAPMAACGTSAELDALMARVS